MSGDQRLGAAHPGASLACAQAVSVSPTRGLIAAVKVEHRPAEHTEGRQSTRLDALASHRQQLRRCRSEMP
jgi:hypothetical protein